jgi:hypothetical protein
MTIEQKIFSKLEPHAKRIRDGEGNDFDYLPAVLLQLMEEQKCQAKLLNDNANLLASIKSAADAIGSQNKEHAKTIESAAQRRMEQIENTLFSTNEKIAMLASEHSVSAKRTDERLSEIILQIGTIGSNASQSYTNFMRLLISGLIASTLMIGLAVAILQRH